jgi:MFS family permease
MTLVSPLAGYLLDAVGYRIFFPVAALAGALSGLIFGRVAIGGAQEEPPTNLAGLWSILRYDRTFARYTLGVQTVGTGLLLLLPVLPMYQVDVLHLTYAQLGVLNLILSVSWAASYILWGRTVDRFGGIWTVQINLLLSLAIPLIYLLTQDLWLIAIAFAIQGATQGGTDLGWINALMQFSRPEHVSRYTALHSALVGIRSLIIPLVTATLLGIPGVGASGVLAIGAGFILLGSAILLSLPRYPALS